MFHMSLEKIWLGPTRYIWDEECQPAGPKTRNDVDGCKDLCDENESCNAIHVFLTVCFLRACKSPVPAPSYLPADDIEIKGYYRATGKNKIDI